MHIQVSRRAFLKSAAMFSAIGMAPAFLTRAVEAAQLTIEGFKDDRVLVVVQLGGGNDGLNTVVPHGDDAYYSARPTIGLKGNQFIRLDDQFGFNKSMSGMADLLQAGKLATIHGVGYPNPNRSHFRSMEIWHTASDADEFLGTGWVGRYFDNCCSGEARPQAGVAFGKERPQAFDGDRGFGVAMEDPRAYGWKEGRGADTEANFERINAEGARNSTLDFLRHTTSNAIMSAREVREAADAAKVKASQQNPLLAVAGLIRGGLQTRVFFVPYSGFDTHAGQVGKQDGLLQKVSNNLAEFQTTLERDGTASRVLTLVFSEFGRRVGENASGGTDHGTAAPMFLVGPSVAAGFHGQAPSLTDLDQGDLKHTVDFRRVYATVLGQWLGADPALVLNGNFPPLDLLT